jgi:uncharacterized protein (DUF2164 family)
MPIELTKESQLAAVASIERYFADELDTRIGNLQARSVLDFFVKEIAPSVYNRAIADAQSRLQARVMELDVECYETEFTYWKSARRPS